MKISERALNFAIRVNEGGFCDFENNKHGAYKPIVVGDILKFYEFDDNVVASGYLDGIIENTPYTLADISRLFGGEIASLVATSIEPSKDLSWDERKRQKLKVVKDLPFRNKAIIIASTISKLENYMLEYQKTGRIDLSESEVGIEKLKRYYEDLFESLDEGIEHPIIERLYKSILSVFHNTDFDTKLELSKRNNLRRNQIEELDKLKEVIGSDKPIIVEFTKQKLGADIQLIELFYDFFRNDGYKLKVIGNSDSENKYQKNYVMDKNCLNPVERNYLIASEIEASLLTEVSNGDNIILIDQSLFARLIYLQRLIDSEKVSEENLEEFLRFHSSELESIISYAVINYGESKANGIDTEYDTAMLDCMNLLSGNSMMDPSKDNKVEMKVFENLLPIMQPTYIHQLKRKTKKQ